MKKHVFTLATLILFLTSCSTDDSNNISPSSASGPLVKQIIESYETENNGVVLRTIDHTYSGNKLIKVVDEFHSPTGSKLTNDYTYSGGLLTDILDTVDDGTTVETYTTEISYDSSGRLDEVVKNGTSTFTYTYNSNNLITRTSANENNVVNMTLSGGNVTRASYIDGTTGETTIRETSFDTNNYFLKNIHQYDVIMMINLIGGINNDVTTTVDRGLGAVISYTRSYTYNVNNYPITMTTVQAPGTSNESTITATISYY